MLSRPPRPRGVFQCRKEARAGTHPRCSPGTPSMAHIPGAPGDTQWEAASGLLSGPFPEPQRGLLLPGYNTPVPTGQHCR